MKIKKAVVMDAKESLSKAIAKLLDGEPLVIVTQNGKYHGIIDDKNMRLGLKDASKVKLESAAVKAPKLFKEELKNLEKVVGKFLSGHFKALPVVDKSLKPIGLLDRATLLKELNEKGMIPKVSGSSIMATPVYTIEEEENLGRMKKLMKELRARRFVVVSKSGRLKGVISTYDLLMFMEKPNVRQSMQLITSVKRPDNLKVKQFLREPLLLVKEIELLPRIAKKMAEKNTSYAICVNSSNYPVGIITATDIFKLILKLISPKPTLFISGLVGDALYYYEEIKRYIEEELAKIAKIFSIRDAKLHIKKGKSLYRLSFSVVVDELPLHLHAENHDLLTGVDELIAEIDKIVKKMKSKMKRYKRKLSTTEVMSEEI